MSHLLKQLWTTKRRYFSRYLVAAAISFALVLALTAFWVDCIGMRPPIAYAITLVISFSVNFTVMRYWVYREVENRSIIHHQITKTVAVSLSARVIEWLLFMLLVELLHVYFLLAVIIVHMISFLLKFFIYDRWVFGHKKKVSP